MKKQLKTYSKGDTFQLVLWMMLGVLSNFIMIHSYNWGVAVISIAGSILSFLWVVFAHLKWALPKLLKPQKSKGVYLLFLLLVIGVHILLKALVSYCIITYEPEIHSSLKNNLLGFCTYVSIETLVVVAISSAIKFSFDFFRLEAEQQEVENQKLAAELKYLKLQINPHFLFNTLNNLLLLTHKQSPQASVVVEKLAYMMRYLLEKDLKEKVPLSTEIEFIKAYLELEQIRIKNIDVSLDIEGEIEKEQIPPALLIALVENAFKHGVKKSAADNFVHIDLTIAEKGIHFQVINSYWGENLNVLSNKIGLGNLRKRLALLYPDRHRLEVGKKADETFVASLDLFG